MKKLDRNLEKGRGKPSNVKGMEYLTLLQVRKTKGWSSDKRTHEEQNKLSLNNKIHNEVCREGRSTT